MDYIVTKQHYGDKQYFAGDTRSVSNKQDAAQLMAMGLIAEHEPKSKQAAAPRNKMAAEPDNKAE